MDKNMLQQSMNIHDILLGLHELRMSWEHKKRLHKIIRDLIREKDREYIEDMPLQKLPNDDDVDIEKRYYARGWNDLCNYMQKWIKEKMKIKMADDSLAFQKFLTEKTNDNKKQRKNKLEK